ncbi:MAG: protein kinase [Bryobacteraceae bacterium]
MEAPLDVKELFSQAVVLPPDLRAEFLNLVGTRDPGVRSQLEQLLAFNEGDEPLLEKPMASMLALAGDAPEFEPGETLKRRYKIEGALGRGGFSHVYLARDTQMHGKKVVVKVLITAPKTWDGEIQALARINHPSVLDALDWGIAESGHPYLVSEFIEGVTLREVLARGPIPLDRAVRIVTEVAEGLEAAHDQGVLHLDIKPENIVISGSGTMGERASVIDFGIAHLADTSSSPDVAGSPGYMAPEMRSGQTWPGCDVYALGAMTFEMLTGRLPDPSAPIARQLSQAAPKVSSSVSDAIVDATLLDPRNRTGSARKFAGQLNEAFEKSRRAPVGKIAVAVLASLFAVAALARYSSRQPPVMGAIPVTTHPLAERQPEFSPDGKRIFYSGTNPATGDLDIYTQAVGQHRRLRLTISSADETFPACSPDGEWVAFLRQAGTQTAIVVIPAIGGQERVVAEGYYDTIAWGSNSSVLLASERPGGGSRSHIVKHRLDTRDMSVVLDPGNESDSHPSLSPDGRTLAFIRESAPGQSDLYLISVDGEIQPAGDPRRLTYHEEMLRHPRWVPDGKEIVYAAGPTDNGRLWRVRRDGASDPREIVEAGHGADHPAIPRTAWRLAYSVDLSDSNIWRVVLDAPGGRAVQVSQTASSSMRERFPRLAPDGRGLALISTRSGGAQLWVGQADGGDEQQKTFLDRADALLPFWVDSNWLGLGLTARGSSFCVLPREGRSIKKSRDGVFAVNSSRDGKYFYFTGRADSPGLWRAPVDGGEATQVGGDGLVYAVESPDGRDLYAYQRDPEGVFKLARDGGAPEQVLGRIGNPYSFAAGPCGIYYISSDRPPSLRLKRHNGTDTELYRLRGSAAPGLDVSANEKTVVFAQFDTENVDIMMIDPLR